MDGVVQVVRTVYLCAVCTCIMCTHHIHVVRSAVVQPKGTRCVHHTIKNTSKKYRNIYLNKYI